MSPVLQCRTCGKTARFEIEWKDGTVMLLCKTCAPKIDPLADDGIESVDELDYDEIYGMTGDDI